MTTSTLPGLLFASIAFLLPLSAFAQISAQTTYGPLIAARYPAPSVSYASPAFQANSASFTSHAQMLAFLNTIATKPEVTLDTSAQSTSGFTIPVLRLFSNDAAPDKPTVLIVALQHGNEPAGGEAALALADLLTRNDTSEQSTQWQRLRQANNILIVPRLNPEGAEKQLRANNTGRDLNRDHLLLKTREAQVLAHVARRFKPHIVIDLHEFTVGGRWLDKFGAWSKYDALIQAATVGNLSPGLAELAQKTYLANIRTALGSENHSVFWYHTASNNALDRTISMGGVQPDTWRNIGGLRNSISILIETRGVGIGLQHFSRRVHSHVTAVRAVLETASDHANALLTTTQQAQVQAASQPCTGNLVIQAKQTAKQQDLLFVDAKTGLDRTETVPWNSALELEIVRVRTRPCGYLVNTANHPKNQLAVETLRSLGVIVMAMPSGRHLQAQAYRVAQLNSGTRQDARGAIADEASVRLAQVSLIPLQTETGTGSYFISMAQPLSGLIAAALEPDSQNSYFANGTLDIESDGLLRILELP
jgi:Zinc carboxypeptidase